MEQIKEDRNAIINKYISNQSSSYQSSITNNKTTSILDIINTNKKTKTKYKIDYYEFKSY